MTKEIFAVEPIEDSQIQPASLDLRLGGKAYRVRASFLPGAKSTVQEKLSQFSMHEMDITNGGVLERGCVYIIPLSKVSTSNIACRRAATRRARRAGWMSSHA